MASFVSMLCVRAAKHSVADAKRVMSIDDFAAKWKDVACDTKSEIVRLRNDAAHVEELHIERTEAEAALFGDIAAPTPLLTHIPHHAATSHNDAFLMYRYEHAAFVGLQTIVSDINDLDPTSPLKTQYMETADAFLKRDKAAIRFITSARLIAGQNVLIVLRDVKAPLDVPRRDGNIATAGKHMVPLLKEMLAYASSHHPHSALFFRAFPNTAVPETKWAHIAAERSFDYLHLHIVTHSLYEKQVCDISLVDAIAAIESE